MRRRLEGDHGADVLGAEVQLELEKAEVVGNLAWTSMALAHGDDGRQGGEGGDQADVGVKVRFGEVEVEVEGDEDRGCEEGKGVDIVLEWDVDQQRLMGSERDGAETQGHVARRGPSCCSSKDGGACCWCQAVPDPFWENLCTEAQVLRTLKQEESQCVYLVSPAPRYTKDRNRMEARAASRKI